MFQVNLMQNKDNIHKSKQRSTWFQPHMHLKKVCARTHFIRFVRSYLRLIVDFSTARVIKMKIKRIALATVTINEPPEQIMCDCFAFDDDDDG